MSRIVIVAVTLSLGALAGADQRPARGRARPAPVLDEAGKAQAMALFRERMDQYLLLQKRERDKIAPLPEKATPEQIATYEGQLGKQMKLVRKDAKQGEVFVRPVEALFRQILAAELKGADDAAARKTVGEGNPRLEAESDARPVQVAVNGNYTDAPVATTPPGLLQKLPVLPDQLAYRFVGRHLTLRDNESGLVVDYLLNAAPPVPASAAHNK